MTVRIEQGDCRAVIRTLPDCSIDSVVTDPPYALVSIVKRFGKPGSAEAIDRDGVYKRASAGFMGQQWDTGEVAFDPAFWAEVLRVLKPGGHLLAFSGTRTYHRMACAIEDAGFEIRDQIGWTYGSGFPKSHDVSKGIDKRKDWASLQHLQQAIKTARLGLKISQSEAARRMGLIRQDENLGGGGFMWFETGMRLPTREQWPALKVALGLGPDFDQAFEEAEREITGTVAQWADRINYAISSKDGFRRDKPASELAAAWQGWGTALKPAWEPICMARKPLVGTVAENVLQHGTGAINIDACRIATHDVLTGSGSPPLKFGGDNNRPFHDAAVSRGANQSALGRWPANLIHDGGEEVLAAFPEAPGQQREVTGAERAHRTVHAYGEFNGARNGAVPRDDSGSAARFFYSAKADADDRWGSKHPTVKPIDLMAYLCRMVTPPGGTVLDPFAGSGTTGVAALREKFDAILVEREDQFVADIRERLAFYQGEGRHSVASKNRNKPAEKVAGADTPLFTWGTK